MIASTGQAAIHLTQPIQCSSSIKASRGTAYLSVFLYSGLMSKPTITDSAFTVSLPPGKQRFISAAWFAMASA